MKGITFLLFLALISTLRPQSVTLRDTTNQYDYIIITVPEFVSACETFKQHKETVRDFRTLIVDTTQIYAEFDSSAAPEDNIRNFISYAGTFWKEPKPKFFLIVGDVEAVPNFPVLFPPSSYLPSDFYYYHSIYNSDTTATDFFVGRIPTQNQSEVNNYFSKVIEYENFNTLQSWMNNALFVCEDDDASPFEFLNLAFELADNMPSYVRRYFISQADTSVYYGNLDTIYNAINDRGCSSVWFEGFITDSGFASPTWFYLEDLINLTNQPKYFITFFSSHQFSIIDSNTNFTDQLMFLPNAGSVGGVVFTSFVYWSVDKAYQHYWAGRLYNSNIQSLGEAVLDSLPLTGTLYWYVWKFVNLWADPSLQLKYDNTVRVEVDNNELPVSFSLNQNYPNPFNPATTISYTLSEKSFVVLKVYNVLGKEIATLVNGEKPTGTYKTNFNASNLPSGIYLYRLKAGKYSETKKMVLIK